MVTGEGFKKRLPDIGIVALLLITFSQIIEGYRIYSLADPLFFYSIFSLQWHLLNFVTLLRLVTVGHCPTLLLLQFFGYLLLLTRKVAALKYFFVFYSGLIMSWSIWIFQYVQYFFAVDFFHGLILFNACILFLALLGLNVSKEQLILFFLLGLFVGIVFPDLLVNLGKMLGFGFPIPSWYSFIWDIPYAVG